MQPRADLHIHTTASDGAYTPRRVVEEAARVGLVALAVTDHDTVDGLDEALAAGEELGIEVVPGIEITASHKDGAEVHVLGYFLDHSHASLAQHLAAFRHARHERARKMVELLSAAGVAVRFERVVELAQGGVIGRPHLARAICEAGAASSMDSAFGRFLQEDGPYYVARYKIDPVDAVRLIVEAGGAACCAHVAKLKRDDIVVRLIEHGLSAVEVWHPDHNSAGARFYERFARGRGLIATGGSDAHCLDNPRSKRIGDVSVPHETVAELKRAARRWRRLPSACFRSTM